MTLSGANTPGQSRPGSDSNEGVIRIPQSSSITETSPSDCLLWAGVFYSRLGYIEFCAKYQYLSNVKKIDHQKLQIN